MMSILETEQVRDGTYRVVIPPTIEEVNRNSRLFGLLMLSILAWFVGWQVVLKLIS